jgi:hypothetical protein
MLNETGGLGYTRLEPRYLSTSALYSCSDSVMVSTLWLSLPRMVDRESRESRAHSVRQRIARSKCAVTEGSAPLETVEISIDAVLFRLVGTRAYA